MLLFDDQPEPVEASRTESATPELSIVEKVAKSYHDDLQTAISDLVVLSQIVNRNYGHHFSPFTDVGRRLPCENSLHQNVFEAIINGAKQTGLAAPGKYEFDNLSFEQYMTGFNRHGGYYSESHVQTDIKGLCQAIFDAYGGDAGDKAEKKRAAKSLISYLNLENTEIEIKSGMVEFRRRQYLRQSYSKPYEWDYREKNHIHEIIKDLRMVFEGADQTFAIWDLERSISSHGPVEITPGSTKFEGLIGGSHPVIVRVYKDNIRWRFTKECAEILSDFVSEFGIE